MSYLFKTEHYEMVLKAGDMERCYRSWSGTSRSCASARATRTTTPHSSPASSSRWCCRAAAATSSSAATRGATTGPSSTTTSSTTSTSTTRFWQRLIPNTVHAASSSSPHVWNEVERRAARSTSSATRFPTANAPPESPEDYVNHSLYFEAKTFLHGLLVVEDKLSMAHGLETRVPFLDNDLVDFAQRVPVRLKLRDLARSSAERERARPQDRAVLRATATGSCCCARSCSATCRRAITDQVKQGFSGPDASWFRGESIDYVRACCSATTRAIYEFLEPRTVRRARRRAPRGPREPPAADLVAAQLRALVPDVPRAGPEASHAPDSSLLSTGARA